MKKETDLKETWFECTTVLFTEFLVSDQGFLSVNMTNFRPTVEVTHNSTRGYFCSVFTRPVRFQMVT